MGIGHGAMQPTAPVELQRSTLAKAEVDDGPAKITAPTGQ